MPVSQLDVWNMAVRHLGISIPINSLTDKTKEVQACSQFFPQDLAEVVRDVDWPALSTYAPLSSVTTTIPTYEFLFAYRYPSDAAAIRKILNGVSRVDSRQSEIKYRLSRDSEGRLIMCDVDPATNPFVRYTFNETNVVNLTPDIIYALSLKLAASIGPSVASDRSKLVDRAFQMYQAEIVKARVNAFNEEAADEEVDSEFTRARMWTTDLNPRHRL